MSRFLNIFLVALILLSLIGAGGAMAEQPPSFSFDNVVEQARMLAFEPFKTLDGQAPPELMEPQLSYEGWRSIRFRPDYSLWRDENLPFEIQFFHLGYFYGTPVAINVVDSNGVQRVDFNASMFDYGGNENLPGQLPQDLGFAGFRLHYPLKADQYKDEVAAFLGISNIRGIGRHHRYGLSARGLAVDTATQRPEEFPYFREFWLVKPKPGDTSLTVYALLDSPSTAGAYEFQVIPGQETIMEVRSRLIQRHRVDVLGIAPLNSMFLYGENYNTHRGDDFRPEVHDSDGLSLATGAGEWLWRPLSSPQGRVQTNAFSVEVLRGFGLMQRDRDFDHYQDLDAHYQSRPSAFIYPRGDWGPGEVRLVQIPSDSEIHNNVVAFWVPREVPDPGQSMDFNYTLAWTTASLSQPDTGQVVSTRRSRGNIEGAVKFIIDFEGGNLTYLPANSKIEASVMVDESVEVVENYVRKNEITGGWRLVFQVRPKNRDLLKILETKRPLVEMRAFLSLDNSVLTETWSYSADL